MRNPAISRGIHPQTQLPGVKTRGYSKASTLWTNTNQVLLLIEREGLIDQRMIFFCWQPSVSIPMRAEEIN